MYNFLHRGEYAQKSMRTPLKQRDKKKKRNIVFWLSERDSRFFKKNTPTIT